MYILLIFLWGTSPVALEFNSYQNCVSAGERIKMNSDKVSNSIVQYICLEK